MTNEQIEGFLRDAALALSDEPPSDMAALTTLVQPRALAAGEVWAPEADGEAVACLVMQGLVVLQRHANTDPLALAGGSGFALRAQRSASDEVRITAALSATILCLREKDYATLPGAEWPAFDQLLTSLDPAGLDEQRHLRRPDKAERARTRLLQVRVGEVMTREPITVAPDTPIAEVARRMREHRISCVPVVEQGRVVGLVTEADMTGRVVAVGQSVSSTIGSVMTEHPHSVGATETLFDVLTLLIRHRIAHVPVIEGEKLIGIVTQTDIIRRQTASAVFMVGDIAVQKDSAGIKAQTERVPRLLQSLVDAGASADEAGRTISSVTDAATIRLIELALAELGAAPVPWLWLACGSQGRLEQTGVSDQDNCLILSDEFDSAAHGVWFEAFAHRVCTGLDTAGYVFCPGEMMAMTERWRQPVNQWRKYFRQWIDKPGPEAQMLASVMFDLRPIHGERSLFEPLQAEVLEQASRNSIFVAHMVSNSLKHRPPLGLFSRLATVRRGPYRHRIDLKHGGVVPVTDIGRVYALSAGSSEINTLARLHMGAESGLVSPNGARDLIDAYEFIAGTRLRHQAAQVRADQAPDNYLNPDDLSPLEREHLREAMVVVRTIQGALGNRHGNLSG